MNLSPHIFPWRRALGVVILCAAMLLASAQTLQTLESGQCTVRYSAPPETSPLNEPFVIIIDATAKMQATVDLDTSELEENFTVSLKRDTPVPAKPTQAFSQHLELTLEPLWHGTFTLPELLVSFTFNGHPPVVIAIPSASVTVPEPTADEKEHAISTAEAQTPLNPPETPGRRYLRQTLYGLAALALLVLLAYALRQLVKHLQRHRREQQLPQLPPHVLALQQLDDLLKQELIPQGRYKEFYSAISDILRDYIEQRFTIRAPEQTTEEFLALLRREPERLSPDHHRLLEQFLLHTDRVKFARATPTTAEISQTIADTRSFIQQTTPAEPAQP